MGDSIQQSIRTGDEQEIDTMKAYLLLENGELFEGKALGAVGTAVGEVVFNTSMTGYQEILTDPSYKGQIVTMTYTQIGNYGINSEDEESDRPYVEGFIVRESSQIASNFRSEMTLEGYLKKHSIVGIEEIDTRKLTKLIREKGSLVGVISSEIYDTEKLREMLGSYSIVGKDMVKYVTTNKPYTFREGVFRFPFERKEAEAAKREERKRVVVIDFGVKRSILKHLWDNGFDVTVLPAYVTYEEIMSHHPDALFLSNGPGDPRGIEERWINQYRAAIESLPTFGICFGHQIIARCFGITVYKMKFGHHGGNHPVKDLLTGSITVTAQNHNYAIDKQSAERESFDVTHINLNDGSVEGMRHRDLKIMSVQHHPEASPGPHDATYLFRRFAEMVA